MTGSRMIRSGLAVLITALALSSAANAQIWNFGRSKQSTAKDRLPTNSLSPYVSTPNQVVTQMLELAQPKASDTVYDLGCGDGRIVIAAAERYHVKAVGIEALTAHFRFQRFRGRLPVGA